MPGSTSSETQLLVVSVPTGNLDSANSATVFGLFKELAKERQQTVLVVTHDEDFARRADRRIYMADGQIVEG